MGLLQWLLDSMDPQLAHARAVQEYAARLRDDQERALVLNRVVHVHGGIFIGNSCSEIRNFDNRSKNRAKSTRDDPSVLDPLLEAGGYGAT